MNKRIAEALEFVQSIGLDGAVIAIPFAIGSKDALALRENPLCKGLVLRNPSPEITAQSTGAWLGCFEDRGWQLPAASAPIVLVGSQLMVTRQMAMDVIRRRRFFILCKINGRYQKLALHRFLLWRAGERLVRSIGNRPGGHPLRKLVEFAKQIPLLRVIWRQIFKREDLALRRGTGRFAGGGIAAEAHYARLLQCALDTARGTSYQCVPRRVVLVNAGLAAGGAERQIVNTLLGLQAAGQCESVCLLAEYLDRAPNLDFFQHELAASGIEVRQVEHVVSLSEDGLSTVHPEVAELLADIAPGLIEEILNLVEEFRARRPEIVHAWQDSSSIKAGIAAVIAGVPRIVLGSRNVTPVHFTYYQDYMHNAYRALASLDCVTFLNNSAAGAADYTRWLGLPHERFVVLRNGVDFQHLKRADESAVRNYRRSLGIPEAALVVGSVFRFWAEKRPMLWLQTAAHLALRHPDTHFLVIGEGPMRLEMEHFVASKGLKGRVHLPGARPNVATPLSAMDVFLLSSEFEGTPNVILEAQWLGLPVVSTEAGGAREAFEHGRTGFLAGSATAEELAGLVSGYLDDASMRASAADEGPRFVEETFGLARMIRETMALYRLEPARLNPDNVLITDAQTQAVETE